MGTKVSSNEEAWKAISAKWNSEDTISVIQDFYRGYESAERIVAAAASIGIEISHGIRREDIDALEQARQMFAETTGSIHNEIVELIDEPFVRNLRAVLEQSYALDTNRVGLGGAIASGEVGRAHSLATVFLPMADKVNPTLSAELSKKLGILNTDEMSRSLKEEIAEKLGDEIEPMIAIGFLSNGLPYYKEISPNAVTDIPYYIQNNVGNMKFNQEEWTYFGENGEILRQFSGSRGCAVACTAMAMSSLGIPTTPGMVCVNNMYGNISGSDYVTMKWDQTWQYYTDTEHKIGDYLIELDEAILRYQNYPENYAPPIICSLPYNSTHYVVVVGKTDDGIYTVLDPGYAISEVDINYTPKQIVQYYIPEE